MNKSESKYFNTAVKMDLALMALLKKKPFEYITVSEICETAGVNRSTFYLHYETIGDLLAETSQYLLDDFLSYFSSDTKSIAFHLQDCPMEDLIFISDRYLSPYLSYVQDHKEVFATALSNNHILGFEAAYQRMFEHIFDPILDRFHYPSNNRQYIMLYYLNGINAIITEWLRNGCDKPIQEVAQIISMCIYGKDNVDR